jgi:opacity protein-like surface antigen
VDPGEWRTIDEENLRARAVGDFAEEGSYSSSFSDSLLEIGMREKGSADTGYGFGFAVEYFVTKNIAIGGFFDYEKFGMNLDPMEDEFLDNIPAELAGVTAEFDGDHAVKTFGVFGKYVFDASPALAPYVKLGLGLGKLSSNGNMVIEFEDDPYTIKMEIDAERESGMQFCFDAGGGIMYQLSKSVWITGEFLYRHLGVKGSDGDVDAIATVDAGTINGQLFHEEWDDEFDFNADRLDVYIGISYFFGGAK